MGARLSDIRRAARSYQITIEEPSSGSHWKARREGTGGCYPIPANNGDKTEISNVYIKGFCRFFDLDFEKFWAQL